MHANLNRNETMLNAIRDWLRGYSESDARSAMSKIEGHWTLPRGCIIPLSHREMRAVIGEGMMSLYWQVRDLDFVDHHNKRSGAANGEDEAKK